MATNKRKAKAAAASKKNATTTLQPTESDPDAVESDSDALVANAMDRNAKIVSQSRNPARHPALGKLGRQAVWVLKGARSTCRT